MTAGVLYDSYYKPVNFIYPLTTDEVGSGSFTIKVNNESPLKHSGTIYAQVKSALSGTIRTLTRSYYDISTGYATVTSSEFATGDIAEILLVKYV